MLIELGLLLTLIVCNGIFAMSEMAVVASRRARLMQMAEEKEAGASRALQLASDPGRFLSTVQVGITFIGILSGAIGEAVVASRLRDAFQRSAPLAEYAEALSLGITVLGLTYVSLIIGELVPKRVALTRPEWIASTIAAPMQLLSALVRPLVFVLSASTDAVLKLLRVPKVGDPVVTIEELKVLIEHGTEAGVLENSEQEMVTNVLRLDDRYVGAILTPRSDIHFLDVRKPIEWNREQLRAGGHSVLPLCDGGLDHVIGVVRGAQVLDRMLEGDTVDLRALATAPLFVPRTVTLMTLLEQFRRTHLPLALVVDEFGDLDGLVTLTDVVSAIVGVLPTEPGHEPAVVQRADGSWLMDGMLNLDELTRVLEIETIGSEEDREHYNTLGGMAMFALGRVPNTGDLFEREGFSFEIVDMDGNRVDRVLVTRLPPAAG